ncbi:hypothetical protein [Tumebacillus sp. BK434]|uniref:hypothetical protein n=1 Tax=Tumebacillus sp. BK434 TaxID=2512169 RepID=UPI0010540A04|nr:hypothetical protein [Tumebacillus sp. BK434]
MKIPENRSNRMRRSWDMYAIAAFSSSSMRRCSARAMFGVIDPLINLFRQLLKLAIHQLQIDPLLRLLLVISGKTLVIRLISRLNAKKRANLWNRFFEFFP